MASNSHIFGSCDAVDTVLLIGQEFAAWCENDKTAVTDYNKMDCNTKLGLKNALESGKKIVVVQKSFELSSFKTSYCASNDGE